MKRGIFYRALIMGFIASVSCNAQSIWQQVNPIPTEAQYTDIFFTDSLHGWITGGDGLIMCTKDAGITWQYQNTSGLEDLHQVYFVDSITGWIAGDYKNASRTGNGGKDWEKMFVLNNNQWGSFSSVYFINQDTGWITGQELIYYTDDGGITWNQQIHPDYGFSDIHHLIMVNAGTGFAITNTSVLYRTSNGGNLWETDTIVPGEEDHLLDICFINDSVGWIAGTNGNILYTNTGAATWDTIYLDDTGDVFEIHFFDALKGRAFTQHYFHRTSDGGITWTKSELPGSLSIRGASFVDENRIWYITNNIYYSADGGFSWNMIENSELTADLYDVCYLDQNRLFAIGWPNYILQSEDAGLSWSKTQNPYSSFIFYSIVFADEHNGWAVGQSGKVIRTSDAGATWQKYEGIGTAPDFMKICFSSPEHGWIAGRAGRIYHTADAGESWDQQTTGTYNDISDIFFKDGQNGYAVGESGLILKTVNGGSTWEALDGPDDDIVSVFFTTDSAGYIVSAASVYFTDSNGFSWDLQETPLSGPFSSVFFSDILNGWISTKAGPFLHSMDGGANWVLHHRGNNQRIHKISFMDTENGIAVGEDGTILRTERGSYLAPAVLPQTGSSFGCLGSLLEINIQAVGDSLHYLWYFNDTILHGSDQNPLIYNNVTYENGGVYQCEIWNDAGNIQSPEYLIPIFDPPEITADPIDISAHTGQYIYFNLAVSGTLPLSFQWQKNGVDIPGAEFMIYPIDSVTMADTGFYRCRIWNECGEAVTGEAQLTVTSSPGITEQGLSGLRIYPNPAGEKIEIEFPDLIAENELIVSFIDQKGRLISEKKYSLPEKKEKYEINLSHLNEGLFFLRITTSEKTFFEKIIKM